MQKTTATTPHTNEFWRMRALNHAEHEVRDLQQKLESMEKGLHAFRTRNMRVLGTQLMIVAPSIDARAELDREWHRLITDRDSLLNQFHAALKTYSEIKLEQGGNNENTVFSR
jgi:hypothetical protein